MPVTAMGICILVQLLAAFQEMITWRGFGQKLLGTEKTLGQLGPDDQVAHVSEAIRLLCLNQGYYNICLAAGIGIAMWLGEGPGTPLALFCLSFMATAGIFGFITVRNPTKDGKRSPITFGAQTIPPVIALAMLLT